MHPTVQAVPDLKIDSMVNHETYTQFILQGRELHCMKNLIMSLPDNPRSGLLIQQRYDQATHLT